MKKKELLLILISFLVLVLHSYLVFSDPLGANIQPGESTRRQEPNATNITAQGGNVTFIIADLSQTTNIWQGFFGTVTGGILLEDASGNRFYDWNVVDAVGEIIATRNLVDDWASINCTNQTQIYKEEERLNIQNSSSDGINDTYTSTAHPTFDIAGKFLSGCRATRTYNSTTANSVFWNVLLNTNSSNTVYTVVMENDITGFNGSQVDFQLLVPVDRLTGQATYFLYVELD